jgi:hypothetical protein
VIIIFSFLFDRVREKTYSFAVQRTPRQWDVAGIQRDGADEVVDADQTEEDEEQVE